MGLLGNHSVLNKNPGRALGGSTVSETRAQWSKLGPIAGRFTGSAGYSAKENVPTGYLPPYTYGLPRASGGLSAFNMALGTSVAAANGAMGVAAAGSLAGVGTLTATGALIVSASGALTGTGAATGAILAALAAVGAAAGSCVVVGATTALGWATGAASGVATLAATRYATGELAGDITPFTELSPQNLATAVWAAVAAQNNDAGSMGEKLNGAGSAGNPWTEEIESGMTAAQAMRLLTAVLGGELTGAGTGTVTIRNAVADDTDRVVATVDDDGNRTSITLDLDP